MRLKAKLHYVLGRSWYWQSGRYKSLILKCLKSLFFSVAYSKVTSSPIILNFLKLVYLCAFVPEVNTYIFYYYMRSSFSTALQLNCFTFYVAQSSFKLEMWSCSQKERMFLSMEVKSCTTMCVFQVFFFLGKACTLLCIQYSSYFI